MDIEDIDVFISIDVSKTDHWATDHWAMALSRDGRKVLDKPLPNDEARLRSLYGKLADHGNLLVVVRPARHHQGPWPWRWPRRRASPWATCPDCRCAASPT